MNQNESRLFALIDKLEELQAAVDASETAGAASALICETLEALFEYLQAGLLLTDKLHNAAELQVFLQRFLRATLALRRMRNLHDLFTQSARRQLQALKIAGKAQGSSHHILSELESLQTLCQCDS